MSFTPRPRENRSVIGRDRRLPSRVRRPVIRRGYDVTRLDGGDWPNAICGVATALKNAGPRLLLVETFSTPVQWVRRLQLTRAGRLLPPSVVTRSARTVDH